MGSEDADARTEDDEGPVKSVTVAPFQISPVAVTNEQFALFVNKTGYETEAERFGWSYVFQNSLPKSKRLRRAQNVESAPWWYGVKRASWRKPAGPGGSTRILDHPVVHISWHDAQAFCAWAECRLPTEAEWEYAARGGLEGKRFPWGDELHPDGEHRCNIWQGRFPSLNTCADGYAATAPVRAYLPNGYGLYNMVGNVWEWTQDSEQIRNPSSTSKRVVLKGGSYLCHQSYCNRYRVAARYLNEPNTSLGNCGFRCVKLNS